MYKSRVGSAPTPYTDTKTGDGIPDGNVDLHESFNSRTVVNPTKTVQPNTEAVDISVEPGQTSNKRKVK